MRIAKLEVELIVALFFLTFEFEVVDSTGEFPKSLPRSNSNEFEKASTSNRKIVIPVKSIARKPNVGQFFFWTEHLVGIPCCEIGGEAGTLFTSSGHMVYTWKGGALGADTIAWRPDIVGEINMVIFEFAGRDLNTRLNHGDARYSAPDPFPI
ncbi:hypothetical protein C8R44DRAFT_748419 [Mycena epipterygia]|nr:hypothetical protein C8R44DRAFT_748419 [Mycena epipterygia]